MSLEAGILEQGRLNIQKLLQESGLDIEVPDTVTIKLLNMTVNIQEMVMDLAGAECDQDILDESLDEVSRLSWVMVYKILECSGKARKGADVPG